MSTISAKVVTGQLVRVTLELDAVTSGTMRIWCVNPDGSRRPVIGTTGAARSGSWDDPEAPVGRPISYVATVSGTSVSDSLGPELLRSGGAEDGGKSSAWWTTGSGWLVPGAGTVATHSGNFAFVASGAGGIYQQIPVAGGIPAVLSLWSLVDRGSVTVSVSTDASLVPVSAPVPVSAGWQEVRLEVPVPAQATMATVTLTATDGGSGLYARVDDISLRQFSLTQGATTVGPTVPGTVEVLGPELLTNGSFESQLTGWTNGGGWQVNALSPVDGAMKALRTGAGGPLSQRVTLPSGATSLTVTLRSWVDSGIAAALTVTPDVGPSTVVTLPTGWTWAPQTTATAPVSGATSALISIDGTGSTTGSVRVDAMSARAVKAVPVPLVIPADHPLVSDPWRGLVCPVTVLQAGQDRTMAGRASAVDITGRRTRIHLWDVEGAPTFSPEFITEPADHDLFEELMETGDPFLIRFPCTEHEDVWVQRGGDRTWAWMTGRCQARKHTLSSCEELDGPPSGEAVWGDTLGDLHAAVGGDATGTLGLIGSRWETLGGIAATDLKALT